MSMNFRQDLTQEQQSIIKEIFGDDVVAMDKRQVLFDSNVIAQKRMKQIANETKQVVEVELHGDGEIKTMADGSKYRVTPKGWKKLS